MWPVVHAGAEFPGLDPGLNGLGESVNFGVGDVEPTELVFVKSGRLKRFGDGCGIFAPEDEVGKAIERLPHAELPERLEVCTDQLAMLDHDALDRQRLGHGTVRIDDDIDAPPASTRGATGFKLRLA